MCGPAVAPCDAPRGVSRPDARKPVWPGEMHQGKIPQPLQNVILVQYICLIGWCWAHGHPAGAGRPAHERGAAKKRDGVPGYTSRPMPAQAGTPAATTSSAIDGWPVGSAGANLWLLVDTVMEVPVAVGEAVAQCGVPRVWTVCVGVLVGVLAQVAGERRRAALAPYFSVEPLIAGQH